MIWVSRFLLVILAIALSGPVLAVNVASEQEAWERCRDYTDYPDPRYECVVGSAPYSVDAFYIGGGGRVIQGTWYYPSGTQCPESSPYNPDTQQCEFVPQTNDQCREQGKFFDPATEQCVVDCVNGLLNNACIPPPITDASCTSESPDYRGELVYGYGYPPVSVCGDMDGCTGSGGSVGLVSGELRCFADDFGKTCADDEIATHDEWGSYCKELEAAQDYLANQEEPNTDTDGDGVPDTYKPENDPASLDKALATSNELLDAIRGNGSETNNLLGAIKDAFGNLSGNGSQTGPGQTEIVGEEGNAISWSGASISMAVSDGLNELASVQGEYETLIANIRSQMSASLGSFSGAGTLQDYKFTVFGVEVNAGLSKWADALSIVGSVIVFAASFVALGILMGGRD